MTITLNKQTQYQISMYNLENLQEYEYKNLIDNLLHAIQQHNKEYQCVKNEEVY